MRGFRGSIAAACYIAFMLNTILVADELERFVDAAVPILVKLEMRAQEKGSQYPSAVTFRRSNTEIGCLELYRQSRSDCLFRNSEIVRITQLDDEKSRSITISLPNVRPTYPGELAPGGADIPQAGCFDGYFLNDYFDLKESQLTKDSSGKSIVSCNTRFGNATCELAPDYGYLPRILKIAKTTEHLTTGGRKISAVYLNPPDEGSRLIEKLVVMESIDYGRHQSKYYIKSCNLITALTCQNGERTVVSQDWQTKSIDFNPHFANGRIPPLMQVKNGEPCSAEGAEQLPYAWSTSHMWPVPVVSDLTGSRLHERRLAVFGFLGILVAAGIFLYIKGRRA